MPQPQDYEKAIKEIEILRQRVYELEASETRLKQTEDELQASEKKYRTIFENTGAATILIEADTLITMANTEFEKLTGFSRKEIEGNMSWVNFIHYEDRPRMVDYHNLRRVNPALAPEKLRMPFHQQVRQDTHLLPYGCSTPRNNPEHRIVPGHHRYA